MDRQKELRSLLRQTKKPKKLPSKLCEYNNKHQLICKICKTVIKSTTFWKTHEKSTKHKQTLNHLLKLKAERDSNINKMKEKQDIDTSSNSKEIENNNKLKEEEEDKTNDIKQEENDIIDNKEDNKDKKEILIDGLPPNFFDKAMEYKKPKKKKEIIDKKKDENNVENERNDHIVIVESEENKNGDINDEYLNDDNMDDTDKELLKLENEMKIERDKKEDELLEFIKEIDKKMINEENKEIQFKIDNLKQYRNKFENYKKKRSLMELTENDKDKNEDVMNPKKKRKIDVVANEKKLKMTKKVTVENTSDHDTDSEFDENDIFDLGDWRTQRI